MTKYDRDIGRVSLESRTIGIHRNQSARIAGTIGMCRNAV